MRSSPLLKHISHKAMDYNYDPYPDVPMAFYNEDVVYDNRIYDIMPKIGGDFSSTLTRFSTMAQPNHIMVVAIILPTIFLAFRLYTNLFKIRTPGADDFILVLGWAFYVVYCTFTVVMTKGAIAAFEADDPFLEIQSLFIVQSMHVDTILYGISATLVKFSILLQFLKVLNPSGKRGLMFWSCWGLIGFLVVHYITSAFLEIFSCTPQVEVWAPTTNAKCLDYLAVNIASGIFNTSLDLGLVLLPTLYVWFTSMSLKKKLKGSLLLLFGPLALAASIVRIHYKVQLSTSDDPARDSQLVSVWTFIELATIIFCSCLPSMVKLVQPYSAIRRHRASLRHAMHTKCGRCPSRCPSPNQGDCEVFLEKEGDFAGSVTSMSSPYQDLVSPDDAEAGAKGSNGLLDQSMNGTFVGAQCSDKNC